MAQTPTSAPRSIIPNMPDRKLGSLSPKTWEHCHSDEESIIPNMPDRNLGSLSPRTGEHCQLRDEEYWEHFINDMLANPCGEEFSDRIRSSSLPEEADDDVLNHLSVRDTITPAEVVPQLNDVLNPSLSVRDAITPALEISAEMVPQLINDSLLLDQILFHDPASNVSCPHDQPPAGSDPPSLLNLGNAHVSGVVPWPASLGFMEYGAGMLSQTATFDTATMGLTSRLTNYTSTSAPPANRADTERRSIQPSASKTIKKHKSKRNTRETSAAAPAARFNDKVAFIVEKELADLDDGYGWRKNGRKNIKNEQFVRNYFYCDKKKAFGCKVTKHKQICSYDEGFVILTYSGRHNHPPKEGTESGT